MALILQSREHSKAAWGTRNRFARENYAAAEKPELKPQLHQHVEDMKSRWQLCEPDTEFRIWEI